MCPVWDAESGRAVFHATMPLRLFHAYSRLLRFDNHNMRAERHAADKLVAAGVLWNLWADRLPRFYDPGPNMIVDKKLVPFRGIFFFVCLFV